MWLDPPQSQLENAAQQAWPPLVKKAGLPETGWSLSRLSKRDDPHISRISYIADHPDQPRLTYRFQLRPQAPDGFAAHHQMQSKAYASFAHSDHLSLPRPVFLDAPNQASLMTYAQGQPLSDAMRNAADDRQTQLKLLEHAGRWLDTYHRSGTTETRRFQPRHTLRYYQNLRRQITNGTTKVAAKPLFLRGIDTLTQIAPDFENQQTLSARQHGDFHMRNLIFDGQRITGIDISKDETAPVGYDIAKILLDYTAIMRTKADLPPGQIIPDDATAAFFQGYHLVGPDDPSLQFLLYARILATLIHVPQDANARTDAKERTLKRLRPIARNAFRPGKPAHTDQNAGDKPTIRLYLTRQSLESARAGDHAMHRALRKLGRRTGTRIALTRDTPQNRQAATPTEMTLTHMSEPVGPRGLVFRRLYAGAFWQVERRAQRWQWQTAQMPFNPDEIDARPAMEFYKQWQERLHGPQPARNRRDGFIYMPLQGRLLDHRSFQTAAPVDMIETTLQLSPLPIIATMHPNETYSTAERDALARLQTQHARFQVQPVDMQTALAGCDFVVTQNSSAAFHAAFFAKNSVLFAGIDFHHICARVADLGAAQAFADVTTARPDFAKYLYWFWKLNSINLDEKGHVQQLITRLRMLGWTL